jgi:stress-induced morphogen
VSTDPTSISDELARLVVAALPDARVEVSAAGGGHFSLRVTSTAFAGKGLVDKQRLVYSAIAALMRGEAAPVHAIDRLETLLP